MAALTRLVDKLPLPSKLPAQLVCHWLKGKATLVLCNNVHEPPAVPFVAEMDSDVPLNPMLVMCGDGGHKALKRLVELPTTTVVAPANGI